MDGAEEFRLLEGIEQPELTPKVLVRRSYANQFFDAGGSNVRL